MSAVAERIGEGIDNVHVVELDRREDSHEIVELLYLPQSNRIGLRLTDKQSARVYSAFVQNEKARDAFTHPYCYVA